MLVKIFSPGARIGAARGAAALAVLSALALPIGGALGGDGGVLHLRCTNPVGGANWPVLVDLDHNLVDQHPATISGGWIKWADGKGGVYELERGTGKLRLRAASTTGGYFLHYNCQPE
jgi:hypothetical protein